MPLLASLNVRDTAVTDAGMDALEAARRMRQLDVRRHARDPRKGRGALRAHPYALG